ncbi:MAG: alpha/beta hydrolase, partial [Clostridiales bacterium]|nr:alpha/beta hydrolase [Clostridiales bacterium]
LVNRILKSLFDGRKPSGGVMESRRKIEGYHNGKLELTIFEPWGIGDGAPCLIYMHGGAFALQAAPHHKKLVCEYAEKTPCKVVYVDYRLAPRYRFPVGAEDCYAAFEWVCKNAGELGVDKNRIAVGGDSAGGALAAAVCLMSRDRSTAGICFQMLIYPVTDARQITESIKNYTDTPMWNSKLNAKMWELYLGDGKQDSRGYASPMEAPSLDGLPDSYIEVAEFDCLHDEGIAFAEALRKSGNQVELHKTAGTVHGFEIAEDSEIVRQCVIKRTEALKKALNATGI